MKIRNSFTSISATILILLSLTVAAITYPTNAMPLAPTLNPLTIPKYVNQLVTPPVYVPTNVVDSSGQLIRQDYTVYINEFSEQILPTGFPMTKVWGYAGYAKNATTGASLGWFQNSPGATFEAVRGVPINVTWVNNITTSHMFPVDPTLHWADPNNIGMPMTPFPAFPPGFPEAQYPVPLVTHLHGGEVRSTSDGGPDAWFTWNGTLGPGYSTESLAPLPGSAVYYYPNEQLPATLWYHDHALGITRINVMSGLAGFYLLRDSADTIAPLLPSGEYEIPLAIQDRSFNLDGSMWFSPVGLNPTIHPYWQPEFFGNTIMVNGKVWPNLNVKQGQYRFRVLDGSNARFYTIDLWDMNTDQTVPFIQIGSDGGYLRAPVNLKKLTIAPGERADILVDFTGLAGHKIIMRNHARAPFPVGTPADPKTVGQIMQFTVTGATGLPPAILPPTLNPTLAGPVFPSLPATLLTRTLVLWEVMGALGPVEILLNGQKWAADVSEMPEVGTTEDWIIVNPTADTHPIHLHLVQFQLVSRQKIDAAKYAADWVAIQTDPGINNDNMPPWTLPYKPNELSIAAYLRSKPALAPPNEQGWKDTVQVNPGEVTIIRVRYAPQDAPTTGLGAPAPGINLYPFDPTVGPGYVWHCHILDHEDNEMMRPYKVKW